MLGSSMDRTGVGSPQLAPVIDRSPAQGPKSDVTFLDEQRQPALLRRKRQGFGLKIKDIWARFHVLAAVALVVRVVNCFRALDSETDFGRRLAKGEPRDENKKEFGVVDACLDLEEQMGLAQQPLSPLPGPGQAIPRILQFLTDKSELEAGSALLPAGSPLPGPSSGVTTLIPFPQPGASYVGEAGWGVEGVTSGDASFLPAALQQSTSLIPSSANIVEVLTTPGESPLSAAGRSEATLHLGGSRLVAEQKTSVRGTEISTPAISPCKRLKMQPSPPQALFKKHTSGWKVRGPLRAPRDPLPSAEQRSQPDSGTQEKDPLFEALQAVPISWSPKPLEPLDVTEESEQEEEEEDSLLRAMLAVEHEFCFPALEFPLAEEPAAATETLPASTAA